MMGRAAARVAVLLAALVLTTTWASYETGYSGLGQTDTASYHRIALAAPGVPDTAVDYQHAQRFWLHWSVGMVAKLLSASPDAVVRAVAIALVLACALVILQLLRAIGLSESWQGVLAACWIFNPYASRYFLAVPWASADLLFALGFGLVVLGVVRHDMALAALGLVVSAFGRQTALPVMVALWLVLFIPAWRVRARRDALGLGAASIATVAIYVAGGVFAAATGATSDNVLHLTSLVDWLGSDAPDKAASLAEFALRGLASEAGVLAVSAAVLARAGVYGRPELAALALPIAAAVAQPVLGGPDVTGDNIMRLTALASIGFVALAAVLAREAGRALHPWAAWTAAGLLFVSSFHPGWSWPAEWLSLTSMRFAALLGAACALAGFTVYCGLAATRVGAQVRSAPG